MRGDYKKQSWADVQLIYDLFWVPKGKTGRVLFAIVVLGCWVSVALYVLDFDVPKPIVAAAIIVFGLVSLLQVILTLRSSGGRT